MEGTGEGGQALVSFPASSVQPRFATVRCLGLSFLLLAMVSHFLGSSGGAFLLSLIPGGVWVERYSPGLGCPCVWMLHSVREARLFHI